MRIPDTEAIIRDRDTLRDQVRALSDDLLRARGRLTQARIDRDSCSQSLTDLRAGVAEACKILDELAETEERQPTLQDVARLAREARGLLS